MQKIIMSADPSDKCARTTYRLDWLVLLNSYELLQYLFDAP